MPPKRAVLGKKAAAAGKQVERSRSAAGGMNSVSLPLECCAVCEQRIEDGKDQALYCEGVCQRWLHRYCAGVPVSWFATHSKSTTPFQCYSCSHKSHAEVVEKLSSSISLLQAEVTDLKKFVNEFRPLCTKLASNPVHSVESGCVAPDAHVSREGQGPSLSNQGRRMQVVEVKTMW